MPPCFNADLQTETHDEKALLLASNEHPRQQRPTHFFALSSSTAFLFNHCNSWSSPLTKPESTHTRNWCRAPHMYTGPFVASGEKNKKTTLSESRKKVGLHSALWTGIFTWTRTLSRTLLFKIPWENRGYLNITTDSPLKSVKAGSTAYRGSTKIAGMTAMTPFCQPPP